MLKYIPNIIKDNLVSIIPSFKLNYNKKKTKRYINDYYRKFNKINVVFFMQYPEMWNSEKTVYESCVKDDRFEVKVVCVPKRSISTGEYAEENDAYKYCVKNKISAINSYQNKKWYDLKTLNPHFIFLQRPYDDNMPEQYRMSVLCAYSLLCYIPYGFQFMNGVHLDIEYNMIAIKYLNYIFADNRCSYKYILKKNILAVLLKARKVFDIGYPRFDLIKNENCKDIVSTYLWLPRWSVSDENDKSYFVDYFDNLIRYFQDNPEKKLIIRPHPLMFDNFIKCGIYTKAQKDALIKLVDDSKNIFWDINTDYVKTFSESDCLISDFTSLLIEYYATGKPIIYCGRTDSFNAIGKEMVNDIYLAGNWDELSKHMQHVSASHQKSHNGNVSFLKNYCVGEKIKNIILSEVLD